jgi:hypothetical protein
MCYVFMEVRKPPPHGIVNLSLRSTPTTTPTFWCNAHAACSLLFPATQQFREMVVTVCTENVLSSLRLKSSIRALESGRVPQYVTCIESFELQAPTLADVANHIAWASSAQQRDDKWHDQTCDSHCASTLKCRVSVVLHGSK